jgi:LAS superfamily LD-carboxypeptidase LdcB
MADDTDSLVLSISADTTAIRRALKQLQGDSKATAKSIETSFNSVKSGDMAANFSKSVKQMQNDAKVLQFQINDVVTGLLSGGKASQIFAQQAGQISQVLSGGGGLKVLTSALVGMVNPINLTIAAFGIATYAAGKYFSETEDGADASTKAIQAQNQQLGEVVNKWGEMLPLLAKVKAEQDAIAASADIKTATQNQIAAGYKAASDEVAKLLPAIEAVSFALGRANENPKQAEELATSYANLADKIKLGTATAEDLAPVLKILADYSERHKNVLDDLISRLSMQANGLNSAAQQAKVLTEQEKAATTAQLELNKAIGAMADIAKLPISDMEKLIQLYDEAIGKALQLDNADARSEAGRAALAAFRAGSDRISWTQSGPTAAKQNLAGLAASPKIAAQVDRLNDEFAERLDVLLKEFPGAKIASAYRSFAEQAAIYDSGVRPAAKPGMSLHQYGAAADLSGIAPSDYARLHARAKELGINFDVKNDPLHAQLTGFKVPGADKIKDQTGALDEWIAKQKEAMDLQRQEIEIRGDATKTIDQQSAAIEENRLYQEGLANAVKQYGSVSEAQKEQIRAVAHEAAQLGLSMDTLKRKQDEAAQKAKENREAWEQFGQQLGGVAQNALSGLVNDLRNGVSAGDAFRNMLDRVVDSLLNMVIQSLFAKNALGSVFSNVFGGGVGGGAVAVAHTGGVAGFASQRRGGVSPLAFIGAPRYHNGGIAGLRPGEVPAILQRGEMIIPRLSAAKGGSSTSNSVSFSVNAGNNTSPGDLKAFAELTRKQVEQLLVSEQRPGGLLNRRK